MIVPETWKGEPFQNDYNCRKGGDMKITIRKRTQSQWLHWFIFIFPLVCTFLVYNCHFPSAIRYTLDLAWVLLTVASIHRLGWIIANRKTVLWAAAFFLYALVSYVLHYQSVLYFLWGVRNNFRFYLYFLLTIVVLRKADLKSYYKILDVFLILNVLLVSYQYWVLGISQDLLGGFFGTVTGCNGYMNIFLVIVSAKAVLEYLHKKKSLGVCMLVFGASVYIAALAEMKFFFAEIFIILAAASLVTKFSFKKLGIILGGSILAIAGVNLLILVFPNWSDTFSLAGFLRVATDDRGYTSSGDLNRLTGVFTLAERYLNSWHEIVFGLGLGNCDYSDAVAALTTPFYTRYSWLHYTWMSTTFIFVELGIVGLVFFFGFFVLVFFEARKASRKPGANLLACQLAQVLAVLCWGIGIYNSSLRTEAGYMMYLMLAIPFLVRSNSSNIEKQGD